MAVDADGRERDRLGRLTLHQMNALTFVRTIPGYLERFNVRAPADYYDEHGDRATVHCPCGAEVSVDAGQTEHCGGCERVYLYASAVYVANSPRGSVGAS